MVRVIVCGGRNFGPPARVFDVLDKFLPIEVAQDSSRPF